MTKEQREQKQRLANKIAENLSVEELQALLQPTDGILWFPGEDKVKRQANKFREMLNITAMESQQDYAQAYQALLVIAAAYGPRDKNTREAIRLMLDIMKEGRSSQIEFKKTESVDQLRKLWNIMLTAIFEPMTPKERQEIFTRVQAELKAQNLPYKLLQSVKRGS